MLKPVLLVLTLTLAALAAPPAEADHWGPCGHEYVEFLIAFVLVHRSAKQYLMDNGACVRGTPDWVCKTVPCVLP